MNILVPVYEESEFGDENFERQAEDEECKAAGVEASEDEKNECCSKAITKDNGDVDKCCAMEGQTSDNEGNCCLFGSILDSTGKCQSPCPIDGVNTDGHDDSMMREENDNVDNWEDCSKICSEKSHCKYWTYHPSTNSIDSLKKKCYTMKGFGWTISDPSDSITGHHSCSHQCKPMGSVTTAETEAECCSGKKHSDEEKCCGGPGEEADIDNFADCCSGSIDPQLTKCCAKEDEIPETEENCCMLDAIIGPEGKCQSPCPNEGVNTKEIEEIAGSPLTDIESWPKCSEECKKEADCKYWSWVKDPTHEDYQKCFLMKNYGYTESDEKVISGHHSCSHQCKPIGTEVTAETEAECCSGKKHSEEEKCCGEFKKRRIVSGDLP